VLLQDSTRREVLEELLATAPERAPKLVSWMVNAAELAVVPLPKLLQLLELTESGRLAFAAFKATLPTLLQSLQDGEVMDVLQAAGLLTTHNSEVVQSTVAEVLAAFPDATAAARQGDEKLRAYLVGQVLARTKGQASPPLVREELLNQLTS
jgi:aspartyl-tRNA(Asn)/glutamyl-tRNA(Gln) amidotransferase subunit B